MLRKLFATGLLFTFSVQSVFATSFNSTVQEGIFKANAIESDHFNFEYSDLIEEQSDRDGDNIPDIVEDVAEAAEEAWDVFVRQHGYGEPTVNDTGLVPVILDENGDFLVQGSIGTTSFLADDSIYVAINPWLGEALLKVTMAHEFYHTLQFTLTKDFAYSNQGVGMGESTAVWAEELIYGDINDYIGYLPDFFDYPDYSVFASLSPEGTLFPYALSIWPIFVTEYLNDAKVMKDIWDTYNSLDEQVNSDLRVYETYRSVLEDEGEDLGEAFQQFTLWNLDKENYNDGEFYPQLWGVDGTLSSDEYIQSDADFNPALFGTNYLFFENVNQARSFHFHLQKPAGIRYAVSLVPVVQDDPQLERSVRRIIEKDEVLNQELKLDGLSNNMDVIVVLSPLEGDFSDPDGYTFDYAYPYAYQAAFGETLAQIEAVDLGMSVEEKSGDPISETEEVRANESLQLSIREYDESQVSLSWNRLTSEDLAGYVLYYGPADEQSYEGTVIIDRPYVTFSHLEDLKEGVEYAFILEAVDSSGNSISTSPAVFVTTKALIFGDLSYSDPHFEAISSLTEREILAGYPDGNFRAADTVNRAEMMRMLLSARDIAPDPARYKDCFTDVKDQWFAPYICYAKEQGWVSGYADGSFKPSSQVSKVESLRMLLEVFGEHLTPGTTVAQLPFPDLATDAWYSIYVWKAASLGLLEETAGQDFLPTGTRSRGELAENLYRYLVVKGL